LGEREQEIGSREIESERERERMRARPGRDWEQVINGIPTALG